MRNRWWPLIAVLVGALVAGCGGGDAPTRKVTRRDAVAAIEHYYGHPIDMGDGTILYETLLRVDRVGSDLWCAEFHDHWQGGLAVPPDDQSGYCWLIDWLSEQDSVPFLDSPASSYLDHLEHEGRLPEYVVQSRERDAQLQQWIDQRS